MRNVKTFYNAFKKDVLFTFYDNLEGFSEKAWNLCYNIPAKKFITFYSWIPSRMEFMDNIPFSFDRNLSKWITKLGMSHANNSFANGIVLSNNIYDVESAGYVGELSLASNVIVPKIPGATIHYDFEVCRDRFDNYKYFWTAGNENDRNKLYMTSTPLTPAEIAGG